MCRTIGLQISLQIILNNGLSPFALALKLPIYKITKSTQTDSSTKQNISTCFPFHSREYVQN